VHNRRGKGHPTGRSWKDGTLASNFGRGGDKKSGREKKKTKLRGCRGKKQGAATRKIFPGERKNPRQETKKLRGRRSGVTSLGEDQVQKQTTREGIHFIERGKKVNLSSQKKKKTQKKAGPCWDCPHRKKASRGGNCRQQLTARVKEKKKRNVNLIIIKKKTWGTANFHRPRRRGKGTDPKRRKYQWQPCHS